MKKKQINIILNDIVWKVILKQNNKDEDFGSTEYWNKTITLFIDEMVKTNEIESTIWHEIGHAYLLSLPSHYSEPTHKMVSVCDIYGDAFEGAYQINEKVKKVILQVKNIINLKNKKKKKIK